MKKYIVFAGKNGGVMGANQAVGYLESLADCGVLKDNIKLSEIWEPEDIDLFFYGDKGIKEALGIMALPERYLAIRAEIADEANLKEASGKFCKRFGLAYKIYEG